MGRELEAPARKTQALKKKRVKRHRPALPWERVPEFMRDLSKRDGPAGRALHFAILTAARTQVQRATWGEIDLDAKVWTVPPIT